MFEVDILQYSELPDEIKEDQPNNGVGKEYANYIVINHSGVIKYVLSDAAEPEDASYSRDFGNVTSAIEQAYELGLSDGKANKKGLC